jgi:hypothetical protein
MSGIAKLHKCLTDGDTWRVRGRKNPGRKSEEHVVPPQLLAMDANALEKASRLFKAIGEVARLRLLTLLSQGEKYA